ncbi:MAG: DNA (cytosine-5)-methyltransferase 1 [Candidatus Nitrosomirales archaeon]|jgi:DNA (cytosine-5)-methyltransferase 1
MKHYSLIDLFGVPGGLSLGFEQEGFKSLGVIDMDEVGTTTYSENFPHAEPIVGDIKEIEIADIKRRLSISAGQVDVIIGGPPCQGFSNVGRVKIASLVRGGSWQLQNSEPRFIDDPRNRLYKEFVKIVGDLKPKFLVMENVPGMISYHDGKIVKHIKADFEALGYKIEARVLAAESFGVPQRRKRIFFIGNRLNLPNPFPKHTHIDRTKPTFDDHEGNGKSDVVSVWDAIGDLPRLRSGEGNDQMQYDRKPLSDYQKRARKNSSVLYNHVARWHNERDIKVFSKMREGMWWKDLPASSRKLYGYRDDIFHDKFKKLKRSEPSWTVLAHLYKDGYMYIHPTQARTITVREAARLQSFPDDFKFCGSRTDQFKQVGNAVPPLLAKVVAREIRRVLEAT